jgi:hypothetical protein
MRIWDFSRGAFGICAVAAMLAGCGGSQPPMGAQGTMPQGRAIGTHAARSGSWMMPSASNQDLLYISSNDRGGVFVYSYPQGRLVGTLTGFIYPMGECTDPAGDVFIVAYTNASMTSSTIYEYAHGGTNPIATLNDPNTAAGCAIDPMTGNLAVSGGGVAIYQHAAGNPTMYYSSLFHFYYCGYDNQGNLYLSGTNGQYGNQARLVRLTRGSSDFEQISLNGKLYTAGQWPSVQWRRTYLTITSNRAREPIMVYRLHISGSTASIVGTSTLSTAKNYYVGQTWIEGKSIIGVGAFKRGYQNAFFWPFPKGGEPRGSIRKVGDVQQFLWGVTVSLAQGR